MAINSLSPSSKGISGLASGMDTQSMVEQMLKGTQAKIDKKTQQKTVLTYKQEMYRSVAAQIKAFQKQFFSFSKSDTNLLSTQLFQTMNAVTQSKFLTAKASTNAVAGKITVDKITSLAANHREVSGTPATGALAGKFSTEALDKLRANLTDPDKAKLTISVGEGDAITTVDIALKDIAGKSTTDAIKVMNDALAAAGVNAKADFVDNKVVLQNNDGKKITIAAGENASGVVSGAVNSVNQTVFLLDTKSVLPKITVDVDGVSKDIRFNPMEATGTAQQQQQAIVDQLNNGIKAAFGAGISFESDTTTGKIALKTDNATSKITISGEQSHIGVIGIKSNLSNKVSVTKSIKDVNFSTPLAGNMQKFSINGVDFSFSNGTSITNIMSAVNASDAGVRLSYDSVRDRFMIESTTSGKLENTANGTPFEFKQTEGNLLSVMFGAEASDTYSSNVLQIEKIAKTATFDTSTFKIEEGHFSFKFKEGDKETSYNLGLLPESTNPQETVDKMNALIAENDALKNADGTAKVKFELRDLGGGKSEISISTSDPATMEATVTGEGLSAFGYTAKVSGSTKLSELGLENFTANIGGVDVSFSASSTLDDFMQTLRDKTGGEVTLETIGTTPFIRLAGVAIPMSFQEPAASKLFGTTINPGNGEMPAGKFSKNVSDGYIEGANAVAVVNGETITRSSNSFTVDGVSITLTGITDEKQTIDISQNTDVIYDAVTKFVEEYNKLVNDINKLIDADSTYRKYPPLTADQKKEMSDKEIELWEEKAKGGLLRGDNTLITIQSSFRNIVYTKPDASGLALYDLGITTDFFGTKDNLQIEKPDELKRIISENPDAVRRLFTDSEKGLATLLNTAMDKAASSGSRPGSLVQMAGAAGSTDTSSAIYRQMKEIDDSLERLEDKYELEYNRYWKQFNAMEQQLAQMNQQSSWLSQQFA